MIDKNEQKKLTTEQSAVIDTNSDAIDITAESDGVLISPNEQRKNYRLYIAGGLAAILWLSLLSVIAYHCFSTFYFSRRLSQLKSEEDSTYVKEAIQMNQETAQTIYTFLTPLAAAVTAFFFDVKASNKQDD